MIVLSGGKKVFPEEVEAVLEKSPYFAEACVLGVTRSFGAKDGTEEVAAVIVPREDFIAKNDWDTVEKTVREEVKKILEWCKTPDFEENVLLLECAKKAHYCIFIYKYWRLLSLFLSMMLK